MYIQEIIDQVSEIPYTRPKKGEVLYRTVLENNYRHCLELGFAHGVGSMYIAGALQELGGNAKLISVDNYSALKRSPNIYSLSEMLGLSNCIEPVFDELGYTWYLMNLLEAKKAETFDFIFIDGAHTWDADGLAFMICSNLLKPGGTIIMDDLDWSFSNSPTFQKLPDVLASMPPKMRDTKQVRKVFELLVMTDLRFDVWEKDGWGYARKKCSKVD